MAGSTRIDSRGAGEQGHRLGRASHCWPAGARTGSLGMSGALADTEPGFESGYVRFTANTFPMTVRVAAGCIGHDGDCAPGRPRD